MNKIKINRRDFIKRSLAGVASASPLMATLAVPKPFQAAEINTEYKAIVCILLEGGADVFNMIAPIEEQAYDHYKLARGVTGLERDSLLPFVQTNQNRLNPLAYGMRRNMTQMHRLFGEKKLSIIANVGNLIRPVTRQQIEDQQVALPAQLFSHFTQREQWLLGSAKGNEAKGWAARLGDIFYPNPTPNPYFNITVAGKNRMQLGGIADAIGFEGAYIPPTMKQSGFGPESGGGDLGSVYQALYEGKQNAENKLSAALANERMKELHQQEALTGLFDGVNNFAGFEGGKREEDVAFGAREEGHELAEQLRLVAQILSVRDRFPGQQKRQIFFVNYHGWDTHNSDNERQVGYLDRYLGVFQQTLEQLGLENNVTTFTISDFGRSLTSNNSGTDHGWGGHAFVMGGAVKGGDIYGKMPQMILDSPDAWSNRMIPTTATEEYLATIVKWFGATDSELDTLFPNLNTFATSDMGFMG